MINNLSADGTTIGNPLIASDEATSRPSFVFYASFYQVMSELSKARRVMLFDAICRYALYREEPCDLPYTVNLVWLTIRPQLEANWRKYEKGCKGAKSGVLGGRPRKNRSGVIEKTANENENENENVNDNECTEPKEVSLEEVDTYIIKNALEVDAREFHDYYASKGWMLGRNPMVDWQAVLRNWSRKNASNKSDSYVIDMRDDEL